MSQNQQFMLHVADTYFNALNRGELQQGQQHELAQQLIAERQRLAALPVGFVAPSPVVASGSAGEAMDLDLPSNSGSKLLQVLPCTRNMKTRAKNLIEKVARLRARLVKLGLASTLEQQKQYFQFRLVGVEDIDIERKKSLDKGVGDLVTKALVADVTALIGSVEDEMKNLGPKLKTELETLANSAGTKIPEDDTDRRAAVKDLWERTITYNERWFAEQLVKFSAGLNTKTPAPPKEKEPKTRLTLNPNKRPAPAAGAKTVGKKQKRDKKGKAKETPAKNVPAKKGKGKQKGKEVPKKKNPPPQAKKAKSKASKKGGKKSAKK